jgi:hypothetical protein
MSSWIKEVTAYYHEQKKNNPNYKFKDALKDLSRKRKGQTPTTHKKSHKKSRKSKKARKSKRSKK